MLILFAAICQIYLLRLFRDSMYSFMPEETRYQDIIIVVFTVSKGLQTLGIIVSLSQRLKQDMLAEEQKK